MVFFTIADVMRKYGKMLRTLKMLKLKALRCICVRENEYNNYIILIRYCLKHI